MQEGNNLQKALSDKSKIQDKVEQKALIIGQVITPFSYKPKIQGCFSKTYQFDYINQEFNENIQKTYPKEKRKIIISESFVSTQNQIPRGRLSPFSTHFDCWLCSSSCRNFSARRLAAPSCCPPPSFYSASATSATLNCLRQPLYLRFRMRSS